MILDFVIADPDAGRSLGDQQKNLKIIKAVKGGDMNSYDGVVILNYESGIVTASIFLF